MKRRRKPPISLEQIEYLRVPKRYRKPHLYMKYRIKQLKKSLKEAETRKEFNHFVDFIQGRLAEAYEVERYYRFTKTK